MFNYMKMYAGCIFISCAAAHCMELKSTNPIAVPDTVLQKFVEHANKTSVCIITALKKHAEQNGVDTTSATLRSLLHLNQSEVDQLFIKTVDDDQMRPFLWEMKPDINTKTEDERNCLFYTKRPAVLKELLGWGADVHCVDKHKNTPLYYHCYYNFTENGQRNKTAQALLEGGAHVTKPKGCRDSLSQQAIKQRDGNFLTLLCDYGADVNEKNCIDSPILMDAIESDLVDLVTPLLKGGARTDVANNQGRYPLHIAMPDKGSLSHSHGTVITEIVLLLLQQGENLNRPYPYTNNRKRPIHRAVELGILPIIKALLDHKAFTNCCDEKGRTPLALAQDLRRSPEIIYLLSTAAPVLGPQDETLLPDAHKNPPLQHIFTKDCGSDEEASDKEDLVEEYLSINNYSKKNNWFCHCCLQ